MLIFGTESEQVQSTKKFLSSCFSMKDMREADVILGIRIIRNNGMITLSQSVMLREYSRSLIAMSVVSTSTDSSWKLFPNNGQPVSQL